MNDGAADTCIFCKLAKGQVRAEIVFQDDQVIAFKDIHPQAPVHVLVIPKIHIESLADCEGRHAELLGRMVGLAPRIAREQGVGYDGPDGASGFKTQFNTGPGGGQEVYHLHRPVLGRPRPWKPRWQAPPAAPRRRGTQRGAGGAGPGRATLAGEVEWGGRREGLRTGIGLPHDVLSSLASLAKELGIEEVGRARTA